jgi:hypothetical protein
MDHGRHDLCCWDQEGPQKTNGHTSGDRFMLKAP